MTEPAHKTVERAPAAKGSPAPAHAAEAPIALLEQVSEVSAEGGGEPAVRRAAILGDPRLLQRMGADQRARLVRQLQRGQGNGHVARAMSRGAQQKKLAREEPIAVADELVSENELTADPSQSNAMLAPSLDHPTASERRHTNILSTERSLGNRAYSVRSRDQVSSSNVFIARAEELGIVQRRSPNEERHLEKSQHASTNLNSEASATSVNGTAQAPAVADANASGATQPTSPPSAPDKTNDRGKDGPPPGSTTAATTNGAPPSTSEPITSDSNSPSTSKTAHGGSSKTMEISRPPTPPIGTAQLGDIAESSTGRVKSIGIMSTAVPTLNDVAVDASQQVPKRIAGPAVTNELTTNAIAANPPVIDLGIFSSSPKTSAVAQQILQVAEIEKDALAQSAQAHRASLLVSAELHAQVIISDAKSRTNAFMAQIAAKKAEVAQVFEIGQQAQLSQIEAQKQTVNVDSEQAVAQLYMVLEEKRQAAKNAAESEAVQIEQFGNGEKIRVTTSSNEVIGQINAVAAQKGDNNHSDEKVRRAIRGAVTKVATETVDKVRENGQDTSQKVGNTIRQTATSIRNAGQNVVHGLGGGVEKAAEAIRQGNTANLNQLTQFAVQQRQALESLKVQALAALDQYNAIVPIFLQNAQQAAASVRQQGQQTALQSEQNQTNYRGQLDTAAQQALTQLAPAGKKTRGPQLQAFGQGVAEQLHLAQVDISNALETERASFDSNLGQIQSAVAEQLATLEQQANGKIVQLGVGANTAVAQSGNKVTQKLNELRVGSQESNRQAIEQFTRGTQQQIDGVKNGWIADREKAQSKLIAQVNECIGGHKETASKAPRHFDEAAQKAADKATNSFWSGVWNGIVEFTKGIAILLGVALIVFVFSPVEITFLAALAIAGVGLLLYGLYTAWENRAKQAIDAMPADAPWYETVAVGMGVTIIALGDVVGLTPIIEGTLGKEAITDRRLSANERGEKIAMGILTLGTILLLHYFGNKGSIKGDGGTENGIEGKGADPNSDLPARPGPSPVPDWTGGRPIVELIQQQGRQVRGEFPRTAGANEILYRVDPQTAAITYYMVYDADGLPVKRVDISPSSKPHRGVPPPHVVDFVDNISPDGSSFRRPAGGLPRPATPAEIPGATRTPSSSRLPVLPTVAAPQHDDNE